MSIMPPSPDGKASPPHEWKCSWCRGSSPLTAERCGFCAAPRPTSASTEAFARWVISLDDDDPTSAGRQERRIVTLGQIVDRARAALGEA